MKKMSLVLALCLIVVSGFAQRKIYISASGGIGKSKSTGSYNVYNTTAMVTKPVPYYTAGINIGTEVKRWRIETGLQYSTIGYKNTGVSTNYGGQDTVVKPSWTITYSLLSIPVKVGYVGTITQNLRVIPSAGLMTSYKLNKSIHGEIPEEYKQVSDVTEEHFEAEYSQLSLSGILALNFERSIGNRISAFAGPSFQFMLTGGDHVHGINFNLGVNVKL
jgi:hypothetical protein